MSSIHEYARRAGVSPRAVRFRIRNGTLRAHKSGGTWMITDDHGVVEAGKPGRRLSARSFDRLAEYLDGDDARMSAEERRRAKERAERVLDRGVPQVREFARRPEIPVELFHADPEDIVELRSDPRLTLTGVSHPDSEVHGPVIDAYLLPTDRDDIELFHLLRPSSRTDANVRFRIQDRPPTVRRLHVIADLLDDGGPRSCAEAERLFSELERERT